MKKPILIFAVIGIFIIVLFVLNSRQGIAPITTTTPATKIPTPEETELQQKGNVGTGTPTPQTFEVIIGSNGLSRSVLSIKAGDTVTFTNTDTVLHWPASGIHPTHQICPDLNALRGLKQGERYSLAFEKAAVCPFHDHLNPSNSVYKGTITVTE